MYIRKSGNLRTELSIDEPLSTDYDGNELLLSDILGTDEDSAGKRLEEDEERKVIYDALSRLSPREKEIIELRFGLSGGREMTQKDVADVLGISQSYISRLEKRILAQLKAEIQDKI
jgi:RNA polymerase sporulation-specific sigma factor